MRYSDLDKAALQAELSRVQQDYEALRGNKLNLNLTRGKPETAQLALSDDMIHTLISRRATGRVSEVCLTWDRGYFPVTGLEER